MTPGAMAGGFDDAPIATARAFRVALEAMARPGSIRTLDGAIPPAPLSIAAGVLILTLCDGTTPIFLGASLDHPALRDWITFHSGAPFVLAVSASIAVGTWADLTPVSRFATGLPDYPDRSATLIVELPDLKAVGPRLTGPGIEREARLSLPETAAFRANRAMFPLGFDTYLTCGNRVAGLPRSTHVEAA